MGCKTSLIVFSFVIGVVSCMEVKFKDCGSTTAKVTHVYIDPCNTDTCILRKGGNSTISVSFVPNGVTKSVKAIVHGVIAGIPVPFPITGDDGCQNSGLTCPLKAGIEVKYAKTIPVLKEYPSLKLLVKWELQDQDKKDLACVEMAVQIQ